LVMLKRPITGNEYLEILCLSAALDLGVIWLIRRVKTDPIIWQKIGPDTIKQLSALVSAGSPLQATALLNLFLDPLNRILLGYFNEAASVTIYDLAMKVIWGIQSLFTSAMRVFLHFNDFSEDRINQTYIQVISLVFVPILIIHTVGAAFLYCVANWWVAIDLQSLLLFYLLATLSNLGMIIITPLYIRLIHRQDLGFIVKSQAILAFTNSAISIATIPLFGLLGAALGLLIATLYNVPAIYLRYQHKVAPIDGLTKLLAPTLILRVALVLGLFVTTIYMGMSGRLSLLLAVMLGTSLFVMAITDPLIKRIAATFYISAMGKRTGA
jgi:O-antigen/teichoic acid export membrane protein